MRKTAVIGALAAAFLIACGDSPTNPTRYGPHYLSISCDPTGRSPLICTARVFCSLYPCPPGTPSEVTTDAVWESADPAIVRALEPGSFVAVGPGDTLIRARWNGGEGSRTVSVFPGLPPMPTHEIFGSVYEAGKTPATGPLTGATIEVLDGLLQGRTSTAGATPAYVPPGFPGPVVGLGYYRILAVPPGNYRLRVTVSGYGSQEQGVTVSTGSRSVDFQLQPL